MQAAYMKIHNHIKDEIEEGIWKIGQRLPSERDLAEHFRVSRMTLRQAVTLLVEEGVLTRKAGSGTYVASNRIQEKMRVTTSFTEIIKAQGKEPSTKLISYTETKPTAKECAYLELRSSELVVRMERVRYADDVPVVYEIAVIPKKFIANFAKEEVTQHFFHTLRANGYKIGKSRQTIYARLAADKVTDYLKLEEGQAVLGLTQVSYLEEGPAFEFVRSQYAGERFEFYLENQ